MARALMNVFVTLLAAAVFAGAAAPGALADPIVLHRGNVAEPDTLDPQKYSLAYEAEIMRDLFEGLTALDAQAEIVPGAAERWTISDDGLVFTFFLRDGLQWSDGTPLTAEDFAAGIRRALDPATAAQYANLAYKIRNAEAVNKGALPLSDLGVRALDDKTVEITLEKPSPIILRLLAVPLLFPVPRHVIETDGDNWVKAGTIVSNGPFTLAGWRPNDYVRVVKNPRFHAADSVKLDEVYFYPTDDDAAALKRFRAGEIDLNMRFSPGDYEWLKANMANSIQVTPASWFSYLVLNQTKPPFSDSRVRKALAMAIDREALTGRVLKTGETPAYGFVPPAITGYEGASLAFRGRPIGEAQAEARALLAEAGFGPENPLHFTFNHRAGTANRRVAVALADMWAQIGVKAELVSSEVKTHYSLLRERDFELADAGWSSPPDPEYFIYLLLTASTETNYGGYSNPRYDALAAEAEIILDTPARYAAFKAVEQIGLDDAAMIPLFFNASRNLVAPYVRGFEPNAEDNHPSRWITLERAGQ